MHFAAIGWKVFFALIPPARIKSGVVAFCFALAFIGLVTAIVGEVANLFGCALGLKQSVTAITFVALGTSLPDTFASMTAAREADSADAAVGNVTGSNSVNVFLGLGLPWMIGSIYALDHAENKMYKVPSGALSFSVFIFMIVSICCVILLMARRYVSFYFSNRNFNSSSEENSEDLKLASGPHALSVFLFGLFTLFFRFYNPTVQLITQLVQIKQVFQIKKIELIIKSI